MTVRDFFVHQSSELIITDNTLVLSTRLGIEVLQAHLVEGMVKDVRTLEWSWLPLCQVQSTSLLLFIIGSGMEC